MPSEFFSKERSVYWPAEFESLFTFLRSPIADALGDDLPSRGSGVFELNAHLLVFAALIGLFESNTRELGRDRKEVPLSVFWGNGIDHYLYIIPMLSNSEIGVEIMKDELGEERALRIFEQYVAGGCEILEAKRTELYLNSPDIFIANLLKDLGIAWNSVSEPAQTRPTSSGIRLFE